MARVLHITEPTFDFNTINPYSVLLDRVDIDLTQDQYHTSLGDLSDQEILSIIDQFETVNFVDANFNPTTAIYRETLILLNYLSHRKQVTNFVADDSITFVTHLPKDLTLPSLWVFGCSHSEGTGLDNFDQCYSSILSKELRLSLASVTKPGSSIDWSLRHLQSAPIQPEDTVIWQITTPSRLTMCKAYDGSYQELQLKYADIHTNEFFTDTQIFYKHITSLNAGVRLLREIGASFAITSLDSGGELGQRCRMEYTKYPEYCYLPGYNVDVGNDNLHFGPRSHQNLANGLLTHLENTHV